MQLKTLMFVLKTTTTTTTTAPSSVWRNKCNKKPCSVGQKTAHLAPKEVNSLKGGPAALYAGYYRRARSFRTGVKWQCAIDFIFGNKDLSILHVLKFNFVGL